MVAKNELLPGNGLDPANDPAFEHRRMSGADPTVIADASYVPVESDLSVSHVVTSHGGHGAATLVGVFDSRIDARSAISELRRVGFGENEIGIVSRDRGVEGGDDTMTETEENRATEGAVAGGLTGVGIGGLWALGIAAGVLPAIGPAIAGGILASVLTSAVAAGAAGGVLGALVGLGVPEEEARLYETDFNAGRTLVTVRTAGRYSEAADILRHFNGHLSTTTTANMA